MGFNEAQTSYVMGASISKPREPADKAKTEKKWQKATKQTPHVETPREEENQQDEPNCDLTFETLGEAADQLSSSELQASESQEPQY